MAAPKAAALPLGDSPANFVLTIRFGRSVLARRLEIVRSGNFNAYYDSSLQNPVHERTRATVSHKSFKRSSASCAGCTGQSMLIFRAAQRAHRFAQPAVFAQIIASAGTRPVTVKDRKDRRAAARH